jgi:hypothetical protein
MDNFDNEILSVCKSQRKNKLCITAFRTNIEP